MTGLGLGDQGRDRGVHCRDRALWALGRDHGQCRHRVWRRLRGLVSRHRSSVTTGGQASSVMEGNSLSRQRTSEGLSRQKISCHDRDGRLVSRQWRLSGRLKSVAIEFGCLV